ncbi:MAG: hypothetical protein WCS70_06900 [Verrucomicrobiota bacterium]
MKLTIDFETRSRHDLKKSSVWKYAEDPTTEILCLAIKEDDEPAQLWTPKASWRSLCVCEDIPLIEDHMVQRKIIRADIIEAHNAEFETALWHHVLHRRQNWLALPQEKLRCSAAKAAVCSLPRALGDACRAIGLNVQKDAKGHALMLKMCKPRKPTKNNPTEWIEDDNSLAALFRYCLQDVDAEHALSNALPNLSRAEQEIWQLDQLVNRRGIYVDLPNVKRMIQLTTEHVDQLTTEFQELTGGHVMAATQNLALKNFLAERGVDLDTLQKSDVTMILRNEDLDPLARRLLEIRQSVGKTSVAKYSSLEGRTSVDGRMRSNVMYHGASTGRWAGKGFQPQNLPRESVSTHEALFQLMERMDS